MINESSVCLILCEILKILRRENMVSDLMDLQFSYWRDLENLLPYKDVIDI